MTRILVMHFSQDQLIDICDAVHSLLHKVDAAALSTVFVFDDVIVGHMCLDADAIFCD